VGLRRLSIALLIGITHCVPQTGPPARPPPDDMPPAPSADVSDSERHVLEVWIRAENAAWVARAEGQLSDLPVRVRLFYRALEPDFERQLAAARAVRTEGLVVWLSPDARTPAHLAAPGDGAYFFAWFARAKRLYARRVGPGFRGSDAAEWSATLEIAALALRTAARAALAGQALGVKAERPVVSAPSTATATPPTLREQAGQEGAWRSIVGASASWSLDGETDTGLLSVGPRLEAELSRWRLGVFGEIGLPATIQSRDAELILRRSYLAASVGRVFAPSLTLHLVPQIDIGAAWFRRETQSKSERLLASESSSTESGLVGLGLLVELAVAEHGLLGVGLGGVWVPGAPTIQLLREDGTVLVSHRLRSLQPQLRVTLGIGW